MTAATDRPLVAPYTRSSRLARLDELLLERIVVLDGAMGTLIQSYTLEEGDFRGERFVDHPTDVRGDNELLNLTRPDIVLAIHGAYLDAGADIIETNTFTANAPGPVRLRPDGRRARDERRGRATGPPGRRCRRSRRPVAAALRHGRARADAADRVDLAGRQRPGRPQRDLRRAGRGVPGGRRRAHRGRRRPARHRDDLRHPQRQGRDLRRRGGVRRERRPRSR